MSNLSTKVFGDMNYLYEHIANRDAQQLNENSDHYDEEFTELVEDIFYNISYSMASEGYSANGILDFLSKASEQDILEKYYDCTISEGLVPEDYIIEQLQIIDEGIGSFFKILGKGIGMGAKALAKGTGTALKGTGRTLSVATQRAVGPGGRKAIKGAVTKVKDIASKTKTVLTSPTAKKVGLGALGLGAATGAGYLGGKMSGSGDNQPLSAKDKPTTQKPPAAPKLPPPSNNGGGSGTPAKSKEPKKPTKPPTKPPTAPPAPPASVIKKTPDGEAIGTTKNKTDYVIRSATSDELRAARAARAAAKAAGQSKSDAEEAAVKAGVQRSQPTTGSANSTIDTSSVDASKSAFKPATINAASSTSPSVSGDVYGYKPSPSLNLKNSYEYTAYNVVLEYLFDNGDANTIAEAEYIMTELDESFIQSLVETYHANLLAEEVTAWVNQLVEEGYDLSEYTWDDMVDYYFTKSN